MDGYIEAFAKKFPALAERVLRRDLNDVVIRCRDGELYPDANRFMEVLRAKRPYVQHKRRVLPPVAMFRKTLGVGRRNLMRGFSSAYSTASAFGSPHYALSDRTQSSDAM